MNKANTLIAALAYCITSLFCNANQGWYYLEDSNWLYSLDQDAWLSIQIVDGQLIATNSQNNTDTVLISSSGQTTNQPVDDPNLQDEVPSTTEVSYAIVDTGQTAYYDDNAELPEPADGTAFYGQDAHYLGNQPQYTDNGDGTVTDLVTGLMWQQDPGAKMTYQQAVDGAESFALAGYDDWRLPTVKELYSLIMFYGIDFGTGNDTIEDVAPFMNTNYFNFSYGDESAGERLIDSQWATSTLDVGDSTFGGGNLMFGVNFADGRIKGYPTTNKTYFVIYVRGNEAYGQNAYVDNGDGTITDQATGLMWMQADSAGGMNWEAALSYAEGFELAGYSDWRLPNAKELQSIVDYTRAPGATGSAAIDPIFLTSTIINEGGEVDYPYFWSSTTHNSTRSAQGACYIPFGRGLGYFNGIWQDVHGAGCQRSDPKVGDPDDYPTGFGPQGDAVRIFNHVRLVRYI